MRNMKNNIIEINKKIVEKRNKLHDSIDRGLGEDAIYQASIELDILIAEYLKNQIQQEQLNKYNDIINKEFRKEILDKIKKDVKNEIKDISDTELEYYCNNIYLYACLKAHNINDDEIVKQLMYRNVVIAEDLEKSNIESANIPLEFNDYISNKYYEMVKGKIK